MHWRRIARGGTGTATAVPTGRCALLTGLRAPRGPHAARRRFPATLACGSSSAGCGLCGANRAKLTRPSRMRPGVTRAPSRLSSDVSLHCGRCRAGGKPQPFLRPGGHSGLIAADGGWLRPCSPWTARTSTRPRPCSKRYPVCLGFSARHLFSSGSDGSADARSKLEEAQEKDRDRPGPKIALATLLADGHEADKYRASQLCEAARGRGAESDAAALACRAQLAQTEGHLRASSEHRPLNQMHRPRNSRPAPSALPRAS